MSTNCPQCGADTSQSSGVVCPACGDILQPGADDLAHERQVKPGRRGLRLALAFVVPFLLGFSCVAYPSGNLGAGVLGAGVLCGAILGVLFLACFAAASTRTTSALGQAFGGFLLFVGLIAVVAGVMFVGCGLMYR